MTNNQNLNGNEFVRQISANLQYLKSYNYDLFSFYPTNREPTHWKKILESIDLQDLTDRQPILVYKDSISEKLFISDGQNRFLACKHSKRPIYAIVVTGEDLKKGEASLAVLNSYQKNWSKEDYLQYYCAKGIQAYINLKIIKEETGFSIASLNKIWPSGDGNVMSRRYKNGELRFPKEAITACRIVKRCYSAVFKHKLSIVNVTNFSGLIQSLFSFLRSGATSSEFVRQMSKYGHLFQTCGNTAQYFELWSHIYNYRKREKNKQRFVLLNSSKGRITLK